MFAFFYFSDSKWEFYEDIYVFFVSFSAALTNAYILFHPLCQDKGTHCCAISNRLKFFSSEQLSKCTVSHISEKNRQRRRLSECLSQENLDGDDYSNGTYPYI